jgi:hypothetical protein
MYWEKEKKLYEKNLDTLSLSELSEIIEGKGNCKFKDYRGEGGVLTSHED